MAKASPHIRSFNAGEFSELLEGRTDLDRYPASLKKLYNMIAAPQGPAISRSGTQFVVPLSDPDEYSAILPFVFSNEQAKIIEFAGDRLRFVDEDGIQVYAPVAYTMVSGSGAAMVIDSTTLNANVGDQVVLLGYAAQYNLNGEIVTVMSKVGTQYTLSKVFPTLTVAAGQVARVYHVPSDFTEAQRKAMRFVQSVDVLYLFTGARPRRLSRYDDYDWRLEDIRFKDGPYMPTNVTSTTLTPNATGRLTGGTASGGTNPSSAFDGDDATYWASGTNQSGTLAYDAGTAVTVNGYAIAAPLDNADTSYLNTDYAPSTFEFQGSTDNATWTTLDRQETYVLYDYNKSVFFELDNVTPYRYYRLVVRKLLRNGPIFARIRELVLRASNVSTIRFTASAITNINKDAGFKATDVGRVLRVQGNDSAWREFEITAYVSATVVDAKLLGEPLPNLMPIRQWRLGYWSDTTGWPTVGDFFEDRLWLAAPEEAPDMFAGSVIGAYETFSQTDTFGEVLDDSAIVGRLNARKLSRIRWLSSDSRGLLLGTGSEEYSISSPNNEAITARNIRARPATRRGSAGVEPVRVDDQLLYVQRSGRAVREFAYVFESDGYKSPSMSQLASHLGAVPFVEMDYAAEPHSIIWMRRNDGSLVGLTYNREENVVGWHRHELSGGVIEALAVLPQKDQLQDALWVSVKRTVNGQDVRYIERITRFWDFGTNLADAHFVDSGLRYVGTATNVIYGLQHLEGEEVYGLADTRPVGPFIVENGSVTLTFPASNVVLGLGYDSEAITSRLENGASDGTAQGKVKRINSVVVAVWNSAGGEIGIYNKELDAIVYEPLEYPGALDEIEDITEFTGLIGPITPTAGYDMEGRLAFRRPKSSPLPFNVVALMPQLNTQDR